MDDPELQRTNLNIELERIGIDLKVLSAELDFQCDLALFETGMRSSYKIKNMSEAIDVLRSIETGIIKDSDVDNVLYREFWEQIFALVN